MQLIYNLTSKFRPEKRLQVTKSLIKNLHGVRQEQWKKSGTIMEGITPTNKEEITNLK